MNISPILLDRLSRYLAEDDYKDDGLSLFDEVVRKKYFSQMPREEIKVLKQYCRNNASYEKRIKELRK